MTQRITAKTDIEDAIPTLKALFRDALGISKESKVGRLSNFIRWQLKDRKGTGLEFSDIPRQELAGVTADLSEATGPYFHRGLGVVGEIASITDAPNIVVDVPASEVPSRKPRVYLQAEASTIEEDVEQGSGTFMQKELTGYVENIIDHLFETSREDNFEDGMENDFSRELVSLVKKYERLAMSEISYLISYGRVDSEVAGEALRWLARINDPSTYGWRLWLLKKSLSSQSPVVRDSAALGLLSMHDANGIPDIRKAIERETIAELRDDLQGALRELEVFLDAIPATGNK